MKISENFNNFLNSICNNIKYSPIKNSVKDELYEHLLEEKEQYIKFGFNNEEAEKKAINNLGTPEEISNSFNKIYKRQLNWKLLILYISLIIINVLLLSSIAIDKNIDAEYSIRNILYIITGILISFLLYFFNYENLKKKYFTIRSRNYWNAYYNC